MYYIRADKKKGRNEPLSPLRPVQSIRISRSIYREPRSLSSANLLPPNRVPAMPAVLHAHRPSRFNNPWPWFSVHCRTATLPLILGSLPPLLTARAIPIPTVPATAHTSIHTDPYIGPRFALQEKCYKQYKDSACNMSGPVVTVVVGPRLAVIRCAAVRRSLRDSRVLTFQGLKEAH